MELIEAPGQFPINPFITKCLEDLIGSKGAEEGVAISSLVDHIHHQCDHDGLHISTANYILWVSSALQCND